MERARAVFFDDGKILSFVYVNHKNQTARRRVRPLRVWYGEADYFPGEHWYLRCHDLDRQADRDFRLLGMSEIAEEAPTTAAKGATP